MVHILAEHHQMHIAQMTADHARVILNAVEHALWESSPKCVSLITLAHGRYPGTSVDRQGNDGHHTNSDESPAQYCAGYAHARLRRELLGLVTIESLRSNSRRCVVCASWLAGGGDPVIRRFPCSLRHWCSYRSLGWAADDAMLLTGDHRSVTVVGSNRSVQLGYFTLRRVRTGHLWH